MLKQALLFPLFFIALMCAVVFAEKNLSPNFQKCVAGDAHSDQQGASKENPPGFSVSIGLYTRCSGAFLDGHGAGIGALATIVIAAFTGTLWWATTVSANLAKESMIADNRAWLFAKDVHPLWEINAASGEYLWRFRPIWRNTGSTPPKHVRMYTDCELRNTPLPDDFDFTKIKYASGTGSIAPESEILGGNAPQSPAAAITPQDLLDVSGGQKFIYVWGWASYRDVFPSTKEHITRFCWVVIATGDPRQFRPDQPSGGVGTLRFNTIHHVRGNGFDDETVPQPHV